MPQFDREILNNLKIDKIKNKLKLRLEKQPQIVFAYLHGSILSADSPRDIDIAVYLYADDFNASHLISKRGFRAPEDYADTFKVLADADVIEKEFAQELVKMARFRNRLVHLYWEVGISEVWRIIQSRLDDFEDYISQVGKYLAQKI